MTNQKLVFVDKNDRLIYNGINMKVGKIYKITWQGKRIALVKNTNGEIGLYNFIPDSITSRLIGENN